MSSDKTQVNNGNPPIDNTKINAVKKELDETTVLLKKDIEKVLERGEKISVVANKTQELVDNSASFKKASKNLKVRVEESNGKSVVKSSCCFFSCCEAMLDSVTGYFASIRTARENAQNEQRLENEKIIAEKYNIKSNSYSG